MTRYNDKDTFRAFGYVARPKRQETRGGVEQSYWTARCRRAGEEGEWALGWFSTRRAAEDAFYDWVARRKDQRPAPSQGSLMVDAIDTYQEVVPTLAKRPSTISNRLYTVRLLREFVSQTAPQMKVAEFTPGLFAAYKTWLETGKNFRPQTVENTLIGARTFLRWAESTGHGEDLPKRPAVHVPVKNGTPLYDEDMRATIACAPRPLDVLLELLWETGMRFAEGESTRRCDLDPEANMVAVVERGDFVPKTSSSTRTVPVSAELMERLLTLADAPEAFLFPCEHRHRYHHWRHHLHLAQEAAGSRRFTFHEMRRAVADRLRRSGIGVDAYCRYMGHSPITGLRHYSVVSEDDLHKARRKALCAVRRKGKKNAPSESD